MVVRWLRFLEYPLLVLAMFCYAFMWFSMLFAGSQVRSTLDALVLVAMVVAPVSGFMAFRAREEGRDRAWLIRSLVAVVPLAVGQNWMGLAVIAVFVCGLATRAAT